MAANRTLKEVLRHRSAYVRTSGDLLDLNLRALDVFVHIAESGSMSSTARRMGLTQSAISQLVSNLEQALSVQLFDRRVRPIALTPSGDILLEKARQLLLLARETIQSARQPSAAAYPKLNLTVVDTIAGTIGPNLITGLRGVAAHWSMHSGLTTHGRLALLSREADIIVTPDPLEDEPNLERYEILKEPYFLVLPAAYDGPAQSLVALASQLDLIRFSARSHMGRQVERHLRRLRLDAVGHVEIDTADAVLVMVTRNMGWSLLTPLCAMVARAHWPQARFVPMPEPTLHRRLFVVARQGELGELPRTVAQMATEALSSAMRASLTGEYNWIHELVTIP